MNSEDKKIKNLEKNTNILNVHTSEEKNKYNLIENKDSKLNNEIEILNNQINSQKKENLNLKNEIDKLNNQINSQKKENLNLTNIIEKLNNQINSQKKENLNLSNIIEKLNNQINSQKKENLNLKNEIEKLNNQINSQNNIQIIPNHSNSTYLEMNNLYKQIIELNEKLKRYPFNLEKGEKIMSVIFASVDQNIHYSIVCKNTDTINKLEGELYKEYPQFSETDNFFMCKGKVLNKFHAFDSNNIKNGDVIVVNQREF